MRIPFLDREVKRQRERDSMLAAIREDIRGHLIRWTPALAIIESVELTRIIRDVEPWLVVRVRWRYRGREFVGRSEALEEAMQNRQGCDEVKRQLGVLIESKVHAIDCQLQQSSEQQEQGMKVIYQKPVSDRIIEAGAAAHAENKAISRIELTPDEYDRLARETDLLAHRPMAGAFSLVSARGGRYMMFNGIRVQDYEGGQ